MFNTIKEQGLNLDTMAGFHFIEVGLPGDVPSHAFRDVKLTYPIFFSDANTEEATLRKLQEQFVAHLFFIYDPFSWVARRDTRFRGGFVREIREHIERQRLPVDDRGEFDGVLAQFLSDVVTIKTQGMDEIHALQMLQKRLGESPAWLGVGLDLLNWNPREKREARDAPEATIRLTAGSPRGFRHVLIDAYQRFGDELTARIQARLAEAAEARGKIGGMQMLREVVAGLSGLPYEEYARRAVREQERLLARHRLTRDGAAGER
jgi:hypothetical protein